MAENVQQSIEVPVPLELFGGLVTEMSPSDLPEGISPDCQDVIFLPGGVGSRAAMRKWVNGLTATSAVTYQKTFINPAGIPINLFVTSEGTLWTQNTQVFPYTVTPIANITPGSYANSVTAFGKEFITFHDNVLGTDIPRVFDGTFLDRATQGGPGAPPLLANVIIPSSQMAVSAVGPTVNIIDATTTGLTDLGTPFVPNWVYTSITINVDDASPLSVGQILFAAGNSNPVLNGSIGTITAIYGNAVITNRFSTLFETGVGGTLVESFGTTLNRQSNQVTCNTTTPHGLQVGFQVQISEVDDAVVGGLIVSLVIDNENSPGVALITTSTPHGLLPEALVHLINVAGTAVGGAITAASRSAQITTITTTTAHRLSAGALVTIAGLTDPTYNGQFTVLATPTATQFTFVQVDADSISAGAGTVTLDWIPNSPGLLQDYYTVVSTPTPTTFQVAVSYTDGTWNSGSVTFSWNGIFYVTQIPTTTQFIYRQSGPDATSTTVGTVTPYSQISPGTRYCVVMFLTRQGLVTVPSPPAQIVTNGSQYLAASNIPIGGPEVIARYLAITGADGGNFFYIPVPAIAQGVIVSTSTVINDNSTTSMLLDFSDNTLFSSIAIDIPGNNLFALGVLGRTLGVSTYASRLAWKGMKNSIQNLVNLGFEGGFLPTFLNQPLGWLTFSGTGTVVPRGTPGSGVQYGLAWELFGTGDVSLGGGISQTAYKDPNGVNILQPSTLYTVDFRAWIRSFLGLTGNLVIDLYSPVSGQLSVVSVPLINLPFGPLFQSITFSAATPANIPADTVLRVYLTGADASARIMIDDIEIYSTNTPQIPVYQFSYINQPEALDLITGILGSTNDNTQIQCDFTYRDSFLYLTQTKLHETNDLGGYEPFNWRVREVTNNCGACGPRACSSGENFSVWMTSPSSTPPVGRGLYIYTGGAVQKLSQEIQPDFDGINQSAQASIWVQVDTVTRRMYVGVPKGFSTAPSQIYVLDFREMDTAGEIAEKSPIHISFSGKMVCSDFSRKWTKWNVFADCGAIMYVPGVGNQFCVGGGDGTIPSGGVSGFGNSYWFDPTLFVDDDYGSIQAYYTTYFFINHQAEQAMQVGLHRKLYKRYSAYITGRGILLIVPYADTLFNPWPAPPTQPLFITQNYDIGDGLNISAERVAFKFQAIPSLTPDSSFFLSKFIVTLCQEPVSPLRFGAV